MFIASALSVTAYLGVFGPEAKAFSSFIALSSALLISPPLLGIPKANITLRVNHMYFHQKLVRKSVLFAKESTKLMIWQIAQLIRALYVRCAVV
jgi:2-keto-4-pentenoate hydratase/2-oxohepta-3-ene-1,7-dioic acid hydratase in catechol pathway